MFSPAGDLICETLKTYCYENDFTLPNMSALFTVISDAIRASAVPQLNCSVMHRGFQEGL